MGELSNAEVVRLAEAARQTFRQIAMAWSLTDQEQSALLGSRLRSPLLSHIQAHPMLPGQRRLERVSYLIGIHAALHNTFPISDTPMAGYVGRIPDVRSMVLSRWH
jgi:hypothetical protein